MDLKKDFFFHPLPSGTEKVVVIMTGSGCVQVQVLDLGNEVMFAARD